MTNDIKDVVERLSSRKNYYSQSDKQRLLDDAIAALITLSDDKALNRLLIKFPNDPLNKMKGNSQHG